MRKDLVEMPCSDIQGDFVQKSNTRDVVISVRTFLIEWHELHTPREKFQVLQVRDKPMTFRTVIRILYILSHEDSC